jgi:hypothetical protein
MPTVIIALTVAQVHAVQHLAAAAGMSISEYVGLLIYRAEAQEAEREEQDPQVGPR